MWRNELCGFMSSFSSLSQVFTRGFLYGRQFTFSSGSGVRRSPNDFEFSHPLEEPAWMDKDSQPRRPLMTHRSGPKLAMAAAALVKDKKRTIPVQKSLNLKPNEPFAPPIHFVPRRGEIVDYFRQKTPRSFQLAELYEQGRCEGQERVAHAQYWLY